MKKSLLWGAAGAAVLILALLGCQTAKPALVAPAKSEIQVEKSGFSLPAGKAKVGIFVQGHLFERKGFSALPPSQETPVGPQ